MITEHFFAEQMKAIINTFGKSSKEQMERFYSNVKFLEEREFKKLINEFLDDSKKPTPKLFLESARRLEKERLKQTFIPKSSENFDPTQMPKCRMCGDSGIVEAIGRNSGRTINFFCGECIKGYDLHKSEDLSDHKRMSQGEQPRGIPRWSEKYLELYDPQWAAPFSKEWYNTLGAIIFSMPGVVNFFIEQHSKGKKFTGDLDSDFDFLNDLGFYQKLKLDHREVLKVYVEVLHNPHLRKNSYKSFQEHMKGVAR